MRPSALIAPTVVAAVVAASGVALAGGGGSSSGPAPVSAKPGAVAIKNFKYGPPDITATAGTKITFTNGDTAEHTATSDTGGAFDTGGFGKGKSKAIVIKKPGQYTYHCAFHPFMHGKVTVR